MSSLMARCTTIPRKMFFGSLEMPRIFPRCLVSMNPSFALSSRVPKGSCWPRASRVRRLLWTKPCTFPGTRCSFRRTWRQVVFWKGHSQTTAVGLLGKLSIACCAKPGAKPAASLTASAGPRSKARSTIKFSALLLFSRLTKRRLTRAISPLRKKRWTSPWLATATPKMAGSSIAPPTLRPWAASKCAGSRFKIPRLPAPILSPPSRSFACTLSPATNATTPSPRKPSKLSPALPRSTACSLPPTASPPRFLRIIPFKSSSLVMRMIWLPQPSKPLLTACSVLANPSYASLLRPRVRRHQPRHPVIHRQLPVVLARMLDQFVGEIPQPHLPVPVRVHDCLRHPRISLRFDRGRAIGEAFLHVGRYLRFGFEFVLRPIFLGRHGLAHRRIREEIS